MSSTGVIVTSTYHTKQLNPWPNSSASHVVNYSCLTACQGEMEPFEDHLNTCGHLTNLRNKPQQLGNFQYQYLPELLMCTAIVWWWKVCLAVVCLEGGFLQTWPHVHAVHDLNGLEACISCTVHKEDSQVVGYERTDYTYAIVRMLYSM